MKTTLTFIFSCFCSLMLSAQQDPVQAYIDSYKDLAMDEMKRTGVPASIKLAQGILESEVGASPLAQRSNNHFGIKCKSNWTGETTYHDDDERGECFRKYETPEQSYRDHSDFLKNSSRYSHLFEIDPADYRAWSYGLKKAGYATHPQYPQRLIRNIEKYDLQQYTLIVLEQEGIYVPGNSSASAQEKVSPPKKDVEGLPKAEYGKKTEYNGLKAVYVESGTSLLAMANRFKISLSRLMEYNDLESDGILETDQWLYLEKKWKEGKTEYYVLGEGEDLFLVSQATGVQLGQLIHFNSHLTNSDILPGTKIYLKEGGRHDSGKADKKEKVIIHEVKPKEGLYSISNMYNISVEDLKKLNNLSSNTLQVGQQLIISK